MGLSGFQLFKHIFEKKGCIMLRYHLLLAITAPLEFVASDASQLRAASTLTGMFCTQHSVDREWGADISITGVGAVLFRPLKSFPFTLIGTQTVWFPESRCFDSFSGACRADCASYLHTCRHLHLHVTSAFQPRELWLSFQSRSIDRSIDR